MQYYLRLNEKNRPNENSCVSFRRLVLAQIRWDNDLLSKRNKNKNVFLAPFQLLPSRKNWLSIRIRNRMRRQQKRPKKKWKNSRWFFDVRKENKKKKCRDIAIACKSYSFATMVEFVSALNSLAIFHGVDLTLAELSNRSRNSIFREEIFVCARMYFVCTRSTSINYGMKDIEIERHRHRSAKQTNEKHEICVFTLDNDAIQMIL